MNKIVIKKNEDMNKQAFLLLNDQSSDQNSSELLCLIDAQWNERDKSQKKYEKDFQIIEQRLGQGAYGSVQLVRDINTRVFYARKAIYKTRLRTTEQIENLKPEIKIQKSFVI